MPSCYLHLCRQIAGPWCRIDDAKHYMLPASLSMTKMLTVGKKSVQARSAAAAGAYAPGRPAEPCLAMPSVGGSTALSRPARGLTRSD